MATYGVWTGQGASLYDTGSSDVNDNWWLDGAYTAPAGLGLWNAAISTVNTDNFWSGTVTTWGPSSIGHGIHVGAFCGFTINMQRVGSLELDGNSSIGFDTSFDVNGNGQWAPLILNGTLSMFTASATIQSDVIGHGNIVNINGNCYFGGSVGEGETIWSLGTSVTEFVKPELMAGSLQGLGHGVELIGVPDLKNVKLTATDLFADITRTGNDGSTFSGPIDLHLRIGAGQGIALQHIGMTTVLHPQSDATSQIHVVA